MKIHAWTTALIWLLFAGLAQGLAHGQPQFSSASPELIALNAQAQDVRVGQSAKLIVDGDAGTFDLNLHHSLVTTIQFPEPIEDCDIFDDADFEIYCQNSTAKIALRRRKPRKQPANLVVMLPSFVSTFVLEPVEARQDAVSSVTVRQKSAVEGFHRTVASAVERQLAVERPKIESAVRRQNALSMAAKLNRRHEVVEVTPGPGDNGDAGLSVLGGIIVGNELHLFYEYVHRQRAPYELAELRVFDGTAKTNLAELVYVDAPGVGARERGLLAVVAPGARVSGTVVIEDAERFMEEPLALGISGPDGTQPMWIRDIRLAPMLRPPPLTDPASVYVQPIIGFTSVIDTLAPNQSSELALLKGLSLRFTFAMRNWWRFQFEGELAGARAGTATFDDVTLDGQTGALERETAFIRAMGGIRLRFGRRWRPTVHFAIGMQGTSSSSRLRLGDGTFTPGPDGIGLQVPLRLGIGIDRRLSRTWTIGARLAGVSYLTDLERLSGALETGVHLGFYWDVER